MGEWVHDVRPRAKLIDVNGEINTSIFSSNKKKNQFNSIAALFSVSAEIPHQVKNHSNGNQYKTILSTTWNLLMMVQLLALPPRRKDSHFGMSFMLRRSKSDCVGRLSMEEFIKKKKFDCCWLNNTGRQCMWASENPIKTLNCWTKIRVLVFFFF